MCSPPPKISHSARFLQFSIPIHRKMKLRSPRKKRSNTDPPVAAKGPPKTRIKLTVKPPEDTSATVTPAIPPPPQNPPQKPARKPIKKPAKKPAKPAPPPQAKQPTKQPAEPVKKPVKKPARKAPTSPPNANYFASLKISNDDETDDDLLTDDETKKSAE